mgnify:CR=1 FL=1
MESTVDNWYIYTCDISNSLIRTMDRIVNPQDVICGCCNRKGLIIIHDPSIKS